MTDAFVRYRRSSGLLMVARSLSRGPTVLPYQRVGITPPTNSSARSGVVLSSSTRTSVGAVVSALVSARHTTSTPSPHTRVRTGTPPRAGSGRMGAWVSGP